eukprot:gene1709-169_t
MDDAFPAAQLAEYALRVQRGETLTDITGEQAGQGEWRRIRDALRAAGLWLPTWRRANAARRLRILRWVGDFVHRRGPHVGIRTVQNALRDAGRLFAGVARVSNGDMADIMQQIDPVAFYARSGRFAGERFWRTLSEHLVWNIRVTVAGLRFDGFIDFDDDRDYVALQRVVVHYLNKELAERVPTWNMTWCHTDGQHRGRPDNNFGDFTGSHGYYKRIGQLGINMSTYPRDPMPPGHQHEIAA